MKRFYIVPGILGLLGIALLLVYVVFQEPTPFKSPPEVPYQDDPLRSSERIQNIREMSNGLKARSSAEQGAANSLGVAHNVTTVPGGLPDGPIEIIESDDAGRSTLIDRSNQPLVSE